MTEQQYTYAVARIRSKELSLLSKSDIEQLMNCKSEKECLRLLTDKGWGKSEDENAEQLLNAEHEKTWELMHELVEDMSVFHTFLIGNDFHNLKAAIKQVYMDSEITDIYISHGTIKPELIYRAVKEHEFSQLPPHLSACAEEAYQIQLHTGDSQLCDIILDKVALETIYQEGKASGNELLSLYAELKVASSDIKIALRSVKTGKDKNFIERALAECESLDIRKLTVAALGGEEEICNYLSTTDYADAVSALKESPSAFERWCDNLIIKHIRPQKSNPFTISPLAAYILARENEIKTVRILLSGKRNDISDDSIRERLREMYV
ncbi:V-type ATPase subunit [Mobilitalea sibirica]|uniref:V-type ATPase subunit n=1 Tax=Mobilitalea sibirica TaxID=1462919 RepID=A0A8J7H142_9FIRM|nr:V-type ATPase subunit [Mobilitalea sibirica]MBH1942354.1 V-type ATPase subunit [Mobilitalea sibirica]